MDGKRRQRQYPFGLKGQGAKIQLKMSAILLKRQRDAYIYIYMHICKYEWKGAP